MPIPKPIKPLKSSRRAVSDCDSATASALAAGSGHAVAEDDDAHFQEGLCISNGVLELVYRPCVAIDRLS